MDVSLLMQENFRPGVHIAIFFIYLGPHRHFHDGHAIQMEFGEGSHTHQTVARIFDLSDRAIVFQATEYQMLSYLADDDEVLELLHNCFLQPDFAPMRFVFVEPTPTNDGEGGDDDGYYIVNLNAGNNHRWHNFADDHHDHDHDNYQHQHQQPPPPPLVNEDFAEIYRRNLAEDDDEEFIDNQYQEPNRRNIIQYMYNDIDYDSDDSDDSDHETIEAQG
jgi:hypothetical protein